MTIKNKKLAIIFLTLSLIICNIGMNLECFAKEVNIMSESNISMEEKENLNCTPDKVTGLRVTDKSTSCIKLEWDKSRGATGYNIYRTNLKNGIYIKVGEVCNNTTFFVDKDLKSGTNYFYKIKAYKKVSGKKRFGCASEILYATTYPEIVNNLRSDCTSDCSIQISWTTVCGASGYEVYRANIKSGNYTKVATIIDGKTTFYMDKGLKSSQKYYYKVRAFKELNGKFTFGKYSEILDTCTK